LAAPDGPTPRPQASVACQPRSHKFGDAAGVETTRRQVRVTRVSTAAGNLTGADQLCLTVIDGHQARPTVFHDSGFEDGYAPPVVLRRARAAGRVVVKREPDDDGRVLQAGESVDRFDRRPDRVLDVDLGLGAHH